MDIETLKRWRALRFAKQQQEDAIARLDSEIGRTTGSYSARGSSNAGYADSSQIPAYLARLEEAREKHRQILIELEMTEVGIDEWLSRLPLEEQKLITFRFRQCWSWTKISMQMGYSRRACFDMLHRAVTRQ